MHDADFALNDPRHMPDELMHRRAHALAIRRIANFEPGPGVDAADRFAKGFRRNRAGVDAEAANRPLLLDDRHSLAELGRLNGRALASRAAADADEVVFSGVVHGALRTADTLER